MPLTRLIYSSRPVAFNEATLRDILRTARRVNIEHAVSGCLMCRDDIYLQLLEGPKKAVEQIFSNICADPRHGSVVRLLDEPIERRFFPGWSMRTDMMHFYSPEEIASGAVERAPQAELLEAFAQMAEIPPSM